MRLHRRPRRKLGTAVRHGQCLTKARRVSTRSRSADRTQSLGAVIGAGASLDGSNVTSPRSSRSSILAGAVCRRDPKPDFADKEIDRVRQTWLAGIAQEKTRPNGVANRVLPPLLYGEGHPYAIPFSGSGDEASIKALEREDLVAFHRDFIRPDNATLIVVGDTTLKEIVPLLEKLCHWQAPEKNARLEVRKAPADEAARVHDRPDRRGAGHILVGQVVNPTGDPKALDFDIANGVLGGEFSSRLNMKLREEKQWAYGAYSYAIGAKGQRPWIASAAVQIDKTADSIRELQSDIAQYASTARPQATRRSPRSSSQRAQPARVVRNRRRGDGCDRRHRALRPSRQLRRDPEGAHRSGGRRRGARRRRHAQARGADLGGGGRSVEDRGAGASAETRRRDRARRGRQDAPLSTARCARSAMLRAHRFIRQQSSRA